MLRYFTDSLVVAVSAEEVFGVVGLEWCVLGGEVAAAHRADEAGRVEDDPQRPQDLARAQRLLPALEATRVAALLLLKTKNFIPISNEVDAPGCVNAAGCRRVEAGVGSTSRNKIHQTWGPLSF